MNVYEIVTKKIIEKLEAGTIPWKKPWQSGGLQKNLVTKKPYRGINQFLLDLSGFSTPYWLSFKQAKKLGGFVKKDEKSQVIVFWNWVKNKKTDEEYPIFRYYNGFNLDQCDGLDKIKADLTVEMEETKLNFNPIKECELVVNNWKGKPPIKHKGNRACYFPWQDKINMPDKEKFKTVQEYYSTLYHELTHSTGHAKRLNRPGIVDANKFGSHDYSKEELVAEMGASFLAQETGIDNITIDNSAAYIASWLKKLRSNPKFVVEAAAKAQKAVDLILGVKFDHKTADKAA